MGVDFSGLTLKSCEDVFGVVITITPVRSQPTAAPYQARGIFTSSHMEIPLEDGTAVSSHETSFGIRLIEFLVPPVKRDTFVLGPNTPPLPDDGKEYWISDVQTDGQGGAKLILRIDQP